MRRQVVRRERRQAEATLREKERLLSEAQRIGHIGSWSYDITTGALQFSDEMYRLLDVSPQEFQHNIESLLEMLFAEDRPNARSWVGHIREGRPVRDLDFRILHANGELRYIQCQGAISFDSTGRSVRFVGTAQDVSERKLSELQIRQQVARLTALRLIDQAITSSFDMRFTLDIVLSQVISQLQVDARRLADATRWVRTVPQALGLGIGYFGASTGAGAALLAAARPDADIAAVVSRGGRPDLAAPRLGGVRAPTVLIVGGHDEMDLELNRLAHAQMRCESRVAVVPGATHLFEEPGTLRQVAELAREWFVVHLASPAHQQ